MLSDNIYIKGIDYPKELLDQRLTVEGNVIGCIWNDLMILDEIKLKSDDFITEDGRFYFNIADRMRKQKYTSLKEIDILSAPNEILNESVKEKFEEKGGIESINNISDTINLDNADKYLDNLYKENSILRLFDKGFNVLKPIAKGNKNIVPLNFFRTSCDSKQVIDWYESQLTDVDAGYTTRITANEEILFSDKIIDEIENGEDVGIHFDYAGEDVDGNKINCFPYLSTQIGGFEDGTFNILAGYSSTGKTTAWITILMALAHHGRKILIISNEQHKNVFYYSILSWIARKRFRYTLNKNKFKSKDKLTIEDKDILKKCFKYFNENFGKKIRIITITDADMRLVRSQIRKYVLQEDYDVVLYDTFKLDMTNSKNKDNTWLSLIEDSREFDRIAKKYNIIMLASLQLSESTRGKLFLDASVLSMSKQIKEVLESLLLMRNVYPEELDKNNKKFYCNPFRDIKKSDGTWIREPYQIEEDTVYKMLFIEKARNGQNSTDSGVAYLLKFYGATGTFGEVAKCKPKHGIIQ